MPLVPNFLERILLRSQPQLATFLDIWGAGAFEALRQASRMGVFEAVREGAATSRDIARQIKADERGTIIMLDMLEAFGYLRRKDGRYSLTRMGKGLYKDPTLVSQDVIELYGYLYEFWRESAEAAIRSGRPPVNAFEWFNQHPEVWKLFHSFELGIAKSVGSRVASMAKLSASAKRLIDVGGGHGMYSVMFCKYYPGLTATIIDSPKPLEDARALIESEGMGDRIVVREANFMEDDLGGNYDAAFLSNIVHLFDADTNRVLLRKVASSLNPGGRIIMLDQTRGGEIGSVVKGAHAFYGLLFLVTTGGQVYTYAELSDLLKNSGFTSIRRKIMRTAGSDLIMAVKAS